MKANELMIGDIVMASTYEEEVDDEVFHPARITAISSIQELFGYSFDIEWLDDCASESCADLDPIPITEDILKDNGFSKYESDWQSPKYDGIILEIEQCDINWFRVKCTLMEIMSVHQLQHALRLCGLTELADNFKLSTTE